MAGKLPRFFPSVLVLFAGLFAAPSAFPQQPGSSGGLWIEDPSGQMHRWQRTGRPTARVQGRRPAAARVALAVENFAHTATGALSANELSVANVIRALSGVGITSRDFVLEPAFVEAEYERMGPLVQPGTRPRIAGFRAIRVVEIRTERKEQIGLLLDLAVGAGATRVLELSAGEGRQL